MHTKKELDERLAIAGIQPLKRLGQNFLLNPRICHSIIEAVRQSFPVSVVEIGPGLGALTDELLTHSWPLTLIEVDAGMIKYWQGKAKGASIIHKDALKIHWEDLKLPQPAVLVSNLPYSIAASLVVEFSSLNEKIFDRLVLMFQKEVAERIEAKVGFEDFGMLSVMAQSAWEIRRVVDAGPQDFFPVPHVGSRVLEFKWQPPGYDRQKFLKFVKAAFAQRRKKLLTNLAAHHSKARIEGVFNQLGLSSDTRAQELDVATYIKIFCSICD